jgi:hypothetical protein
MRWKSGQEIDGSFVQRETARPEALGSFRWWPANIGFRDRLLSGNFLVFGIRRSAKPTPLGSLRCQLRA